MCVCIRKKKGGGGGRWASPYVMRARVALRLKEVEYELLQEKFGEKSELLLKSNPVYKKIPVLLHNHNPVCESLIIVAYVDETWPAAGPDLLPPDPSHRALHRFWAAYLDDEWFPSMSRAARAETEEAKAAALEQITAGLQLLEAAFAQLCGGRSFFGGDTVGYLDLALGCYLGWMKACEGLTGLRFLDDEKTPLLARWAERFGAHEAVREVMPEVEKLMELGKAMMATRKASSPC